MAATDRGESFAIFKEFLSPASSSVVTKIHRLSSSPGANNKEICQQLNADTILCSAPLHTPHQVQDQSPPLPTFPVAGSAPVNTTSAKDQDKNHTPTLVTVSVKNISGDNERQHNFYYQPQSAREFNNRQ
ncbi:hypothetical protein M9H77_13127 [Catharanthus roseus]|uniref:Uncharacterized protein n=1 Tax=Catharanthus roseus TaxID=4058 RepID=A0ACC0BJG9_CATRO|nr:hypothetical protein M9H77_13127 [Catharanthus roseus]